MNSNNQVTGVAAFGIYPPNVDLENVAQTLNQAGFSNENICLLLAAGHPLATLVRDLKLLSSEADHAASSGLMRWLLRLGAVVIPGVGFFIRSRDFLHQLMVGPKTSSCAGAAASLINLGVPEKEATRLGEFMSDTGGLVYVRSDQVAQSQWAREILRRTGAWETSCLQEPPEANGAFLRRRSSLSGSHYNVPVL